MEKQDLVKLVPGATLKEKPTFKLNFGFEFEHTGRKKGPKTPRQAPNRGNYPDSDLPKAMHKLRRRSDFGDYDSDVGSKVVTNHKSDENVGKSCADQTLFPTAKVIDKKRV